MIIIALIFAILFLALALWRLDYALFALIASLPIYLIRFSILGVPSTFLEIMILISFAVWFLKKWLTNIKSLFKKSGHSESVNLISLSQF